MMKKARIGETAVTQDGQVVTVRQVYRAADKRVTVLTSPDNEWHTAYELKRPGKVQS
jgi:hypothetical protein